MTKIICYSGRIPDSFADNLLERSNNSTVIYVPGLGTREEGMGGTLFGAEAKKREQSTLAQVGRQMETIYGADPEAKVIIIGTGFSRGSFQLRDFANLVNEGVPIPRSDDGSGRSKVYSGDQAPRFGAMILYDTVGSMGIPGNNANFGFNANIAPNVEHVLHVTADDEWRSLFPISSVTNSTDVHSFRNDGRIVQIGIPGVHSDIGGSYAGAYQYFALDMGYSVLQQLGVPLQPLTNSAKGYDYNVANYSMSSMRLHDSSFKIDKFFNAIGLESRNRTAYPAHNPPYQPRKGP